MIPPEIVKKIRQIQIYTRRAVNASFAGQYESVFKGRGMQFDEVREYMPGDDIRTIDWNVTARTGKPFIKRFVEEREMTVIFAVDLSASGEFGTYQKTKNELAAKFCAVLAFAAARNNDKVGLLIFTDRIELYIPPKKGTSHMLRLIRDLLCFQVKSKKTNISQALDYLAKVLTKKATVFLVSDFLAIDYEKSLTLLNKRHDVIGVCVADKAERNFPNVGLAEMADAETGQKTVVDTSAGRFVSAYNKITYDRQGALSQMFRSMGVDSINIGSDKDYVHQLVEFFRLRHRRY